MKAIKKFLALSALVVCVFTMALVGITALCCICGMFMSVVACLWKEAFIVTAIGAICTIGFFTLLDIADWFLSVYKQLNKK